MRMCNLDCRRVVWWRLHRLSPSGRSATLELLRTTPFVQTTHRLLNRTMKSVEQYTKLIYSLTFSLTYREENPIHIYKRHFISIYYNWMLLNIFITDKSFIDRVGPGSWLCENVLYSIYINNTQRWCKLYMFINITIYNHCNLKIETFHFETHINLL